MCKQDEDPDLSEFLAAECAQGARGGVCVGGGKHFLKKVYTFFLF